MNESKQKPGAALVADHDDVLQQHTDGSMVNHNNLSPGTTTVTGRAVYRMVALDLDGTLLQSTNHQIDDKQAQYLRNLYTTTGVKICIATGRAAPSVYEHIKKLALPDPIPVVCSNGARGVFMTSTTTTSSSSSSLSRSSTSQLNNDGLHEEIFATPVSYDVTKKTIDLATELGYCIQYYVDDYIYANPTTEAHTGLLQLYTDITQNPIIPVSDNFNNLLYPHSKLQEDPTNTVDTMEQGNPSNNTNDSSSTSCTLPSKLLVRFDKGEFETAHAAFKDLLHPPNEESGGNNSGCHPPKKLATIIPGFMPSTDWFLEILHPDVNKGVGLRRMCETLNIPINEVVAIGDGTNDTEFLQFAGLGIAMKNAHTTLKDVADYTTDWTNDEQGVRRTLERLQTMDQLCSL
jgi:hydroxymethylpyrimidine pyrophosphatase-like HAD family hydrolase